jgi:hypothetical protein
MPETVLPAIAFTITTIGFLATVRNGIDLILKDKDHVQGFVVTDLIHVSIELTLLSNRLEKWKDLWSIYDEVPRSHLYTYWGNSGASQIIEVLSTAEHLSREIEKEFESKYGRTRADTIKRLGKYEKTSEKRRLKKMEGLMKEYDVKYGVASRIKLALFDSPTFQAHVKSLRDTLSGLETLSVSEFERKYEIEYDKETARKLGLGSHLLFLAKEAKKSSTDLITWCKKQTLPGTLAIDFQLDAAHGSGSQAREKCIAQRAARKGFPYQLRLSNEANITERCREVIFQGEANYVGLAHLVERLSAVPCNPNVPASKPQALQEGIRGDSNADISRQGSESLRKVLSRQPRDLLKSHHHQFSLPERYQLAYELCESALILLASTWFCELCICAIQRVHIDHADDKYKHFVRVKNAHELEIGTGNTGNSDLWCRRELLNMHLCRLGIILVEISTGAVVQDAKYDSQSGEVVMILDISGKAERPSQGCSPYDVADIVKEAAGIDLSSAVIYCLRRNTTPDTVTENDLAAFYNRVVAPWVFSQWYW